MTAAKRNRARHLWNDISLTLASGFGVPLEAGRRFTRLREVKDRIDVPNVDKNYALSALRSLDRKRWYNNPSIVGDPSTTRVITSDINIGSQVTAIDQTISSTDPKGGKLPDVEHRPLLPLKPSIQPPQADTDDFIVEEIMITLCRWMNLTRPETSCEVWSRQSQLLGEKPTLSGNNSMAFDDDLGSPKRKSSRHKPTPNGSRSWLRNDSLPDTDIGSSKRLTEAAIKYLYPERPSSTVAENGSVEEESDLSGHRCTALTNNMKEFQINSDADKENNDDFEHVSMASEYSWDMMENDC